MESEIDIEAVAEQRDELLNVDDMYDHDEEIPITGLFAAAFVHTHTDFESFDDLVAASPSDAACATELGTVPHGAWDEFVAETTGFEDEQALVMAARDQWVAKKLDLA